MNKRNKIFPLIKTCVITFILFFATCPNLTIATSQISNIEDAARFVIERLLYNADELLIHIWGPVSKGEKIFSAKKHILNAPEKGYIIYIDLYPRANLFHPVQYVFLSESTMEIILIDAISPPSNFADYQIIETEIGKLFTSVENRRANIPQRKISVDIQKSSDTRWAVLMNGGYSSGSNHVRYWNDLSNIYVALNYVYGFPDENIIVLCSDGLNPAPDQSNGLNSDPDLDGDGDDDIMYSCVLSEVDMVFTDLVNTLTENDKLFIFTTDHGNSVGGWNVVQNLWNYEELTDAHFASLLDALPDCEIICTFEPCFSGGFLDDVVVPPGPVIASSACRHDEYSWAMTNLEYDEYVFHWTAAVKGEDAYGISVDADYNLDGKITMDEAYSYAETHDIQPEEPQYNDFPENIGSIISLHPTNLAPENPQKPIGPEEGIILEEYSFFTSTTDPEEDQIYYWFDWGDNTNTGWLGPFISGTSIEESHTWYDSGNYSVKVKAKDEKNSESDWSEPLTINISKPVLKIETIKGKFFKVNAPIRNTGNAYANGVNWSINLQGGIVLIGEETNGTISSISPGGEEIISSGIIFGFGQTRIFVTVEEPYGSADIRDQGAQMFLFFIKVNPGGGI